ncbi:hypothetical protein GGR56DRAFT_630837 [Xylariaceae sp. FL0804]|nr:hypothetical protein GGR56DRAFT_630837 [Xylariaceae sp. FL0804]
MIDDVHSLHGLGIVVGDITSRNFLGGKIGDFSHSSTVPCMAVDGPYAGFLHSSEGWWDIGSLEEMIDEWNECLPARFRIRDRPLTGTTGGRVLRPGRDRRLPRIWPDVKSYDWRGSSMEKGLTAGRREGEAQGKEQKDGKGKSSGKKKKGKVSRGQATGKNIKKKSAKTEKPTGFTAAGKR